MDPERVIAGTTAHGATFLNPGAIRHAGEGETVIGPWTQAGRDHADSLAGFFSGAGIPTRAVTDVHTVLWAKLFVNIGINAITALTGIKNGQLLDLSQTRELAREAVSEAMAVARAKGIEIQGDPVEKVYRIAEATGPNRSSMGQDVDQHRLSEINAINGFIVRMAKQAGIAVPVNQTLTTLIETLEAHY
jgi:2-dehydropantoate 2-reductase